MMVIVNAGTPQLQCLSIRTSTEGWLEAPAVILQGCGGFHNFVHVPELRTLDLEHFSFGQTAEFHLGTCLARLVHLQVSYLVALQCLKHSGLILLLPLSKAGLTGLQCVTNAGHQCSMQGTSAQCRLPMHVLRPIEPHSLHPITCNCRCCGINPACNALLSADEFASYSNCC